MNKNVIVPPAAAQAMADLQAMCSKCPNATYVPKPGELPHCGFTCESTIGYEDIIETAWREQTVGQLISALNQLAAKRAPRERILNSREFSDVEALLEEVASWCQGHLDKEGLDEVKEIFNRHRRIPKYNGAADDQGRTWYEVCRPEPVEQHNCSTCSLEECSQHGCNRSVYCQFYTGGPIREVRL